MPAALCGCTHAAGSNKARGARSYLTSTASSDHYPLSQGVDGIYNTIIHSKSGDAQPIYSVDLGAIIEVTGIIIVNRRDWWVGWK